MTSTPRTWVVGEVVTAAYLNAEIRDQFNSFFGAWTTYTPTWGSSGTQPAIGNGTLAGRYLKVGRTVWCHVNWIAGSTSTYGTGNHNFSIPATSANVGVSWAGSAHFIGTARWLGGSLISANASVLAPFFQLSSSDNRTDQMTSARPETLASGAQLRIDITYEAAS